MDYSLQQRHATGLEASGCTGVGGSWRHFNHLGYLTYVPILWPLEFYFWVTHISSTVQCASRTSRHSSVCPDLVGY